MFLLNPFICLALAVPASPACTAAPAAPAEPVASVACEAGYLGVYVLSAEEGGASVSRIMSGSPAEEIGLQPGDRIVSLGGEEVDGADGLTAAISARHAGEEVEVAFHRGEQHITRTVKLGKRADAEASGMFQVPAPVAEAAPAAPSNGFGFPQWQSQGQGQMELPRFPNAFTAPMSAPYQQAQQLEQRLDELRRRMDERFADLSQRLQALREERQDGAFHERMTRLQAELEAERVDQERRADELRAAVRAREAEQQQAAGQLFRAWSAPAQQGAGSSASEVQALRDEVQALRDEIRELKELMTR